MKTYSEYLGKRFGKWVVRQVIGRDKNRNVKIISECDCGTLKEVKLTSLRFGTSTQCMDCALRNLNKYSHGKSYSKSYSTWQAMLKRCRDKNHIAYKNYGGRGIKVCDEWLIFINFFRDMGDRPHKMTLDRIDNEGNYEKANCRWATRVEQSQNKRSTI